MKRNITRDLKAALFAVMMITGALITLSICGAWVLLTAEGCEYLMKSEGSNALGLTPVFAREVIEAICRDMAVSGKTTELYMSIVYIYIGIMVCIQIGYVCKVFVNDITEVFIGGASGISEFLITALFGITPFIIGNVISGILYGKAFFALGYAFYLALALSLIRILCVAFLHVYYKKMIKHLNRVME